MKIGILTSGGDCPGLNAVLRAFVKYAYNNIPNCEVIGIEEGYLGLMERRVRPLTIADVDGIMDLGGTILGSTRTPYKQMMTSYDGESTRLKKMVDNYKKLKLDLVVTLGGAGTHKTASLLTCEGCNVIALPKTIDNDIFGTDLTFGFETAVDTAVDSLKRIRSTADSHSRVFFVEIMGNKVGHLALHAGIGAGVDAIIIPEIPYSEVALADYVKERVTSGHRSTIIAISEGAKSETEVALDKKGRKDYVASFGGSNSASHRAAKIVEFYSGITCHTTILGHTQRGGSPNAYDRILCTQIGAYGGQLALEGKYGVTVCVKGNKLTYNPLVEIAGRAKKVAVDSQLITLAKGIGIYFGESNNLGESNNIV